MVESSYFRKSEDQQERNFRWSNMDSWLVSYIVKYFTTKGQ